MLKGKRTTKLLQALPRVSARRLTSTKSSSQSPITPRLSSTRKLFRWAAEAKRAAKRGSQLGQGRGILKKANSRDSRRACGKTFGGVRQRNPSDGEHGDGNGAADCGEPLEPLWRAECRFRWRGEDGAKTKIICAAARGGIHTFQVVEGNTNKEITRLRCVRRIRP